MARPSATGSPAASEAAAARETTAPWSRREIAALAGAFIAGLAIRLAILSAPPFRDDVDQFVRWVHGIAVNGLPNAYDQDLSFGPVIAYLWGLLAAVQPGFQTATDASDPVIGVLMRIPGSLADIGLAAVVVYALQRDPRWAIGGAAVILLHPAVIDISAWWGQYESIYLLPALAAAVLAINGRNGWAAAAIAISLMAKPQALPMLVPLAAWFWSRGGPREVVRAVAIGAAVIVVLWLPFLAANGPANYLDNLAEYQGGVFAVLSLRAWNVWWLVQEGAAGGAFIVDNVAVLGPFTLRHVGFATAGLLELVVALAIVRNPQPRSLVLGLAASVLVAFTFLTSMHERYAYGAIIFLVLLIPDARARWLSVALGVVFTLNLLAAVPPTPQIGELLPVAGLLGVVGSLAMLMITSAAVMSLPGQVADDAPS